MKPVLFALALAAALSGCATAPVTAPSGARSGSVGARQVEPEPGAAKLPVGLVGVLGIGEIYGQRLAAAGITSRQALLEAGATPYRRDRLSEGTGIPLPLIQSWVNQADLMRVPGVGPEYAALLERAGVASAAELAQRNPDSLSAMITAANDLGNGRAMVNRLPSATTLAGWIEAAIGIERVVTR